MLESILTNIAYLYYPKRLCAVKDRTEYLARPEFIRLTETLENSLAENEASLHQLLLNIKGLPEFESIQDMSRHSWLDRCSTFEISYFGENRLDRIIILISLLVPYYVIYVLDNEIQKEPYRWKTHPQRNITKENDLYKMHFEKLEEIIQQSIKFTRLSDDTLSTSIEDLSFQDVTFDEFTLFSAFFLDDNNFTPLRKPETDL